MRNTVRAFCAITGSAAIGGRPVRGARIHPIQFTGAGRPVPGGGAVAFVSRLSMEDFGPGGARILGSGVIKTPNAYRP